MPNQLRASLLKKQFCYIVELVASRHTAEDQIFDTAGKMADVPGVMAGSVTNYAGGALGHDPVRISIGVRARGLTPNIHVTCVSENRFGLREKLQDLSTLGIENVLALTGDYPKSGPATFDIDSVQLISLIAELRNAGMPFWVGAAISPFKYTEPDCAYQYLKLGKKIAAGADYVITQIGYDVRKFRELKRYLNERVGPFPALGAVYVLNKTAAEKMSKGQPPGCWVSPSLLEKIRSESQSTDKGKAARLERAARLAAVLRGLNYSGVYIGGTSDPAQVHWIIQRAEALFPRWEELAEGMVYAPSNAYYVYESSRRASERRGVIPNIFGHLARIFPVNKESRLRRFLTTVLAWIAKHPTLARTLERGELALKSPLFGCQACGNCILGSMEYVCPQTCPKQLRNGPCGGTHNGKCEVVDKPCIWISVYERAKAAHDFEDLKMYVPPPDRTLQGTSSWINYFLKRDVRPYVRPFSKDTTELVHGGGRDGSSEPAVVARMENEHASAPNSSK